MQLATETTGASPACFATPCPRSLRSVCHTWPMLQSSACQHRRLAQWHAPQRSWVRVRMSAIADESDSYGGLRCVHRHHSTVIWLKLSS